jgi:hypothetical protein
MDASQLQIPSQNQEPQADATKLAKIVAYMLLSNVVLGCVRHPGPGATDTSHFALMVTKSNPEVLKAWIWELGHEKMRLPNNPCTIRLHGGPISTTKSGTAIMRVTHTRKGPYAPERGLRGLVRARNGLAHIVSGWPSNEEMSTQALAWNSHFFGPTVEPMVLNAGMVGLMIESTKSEIPDEESFQWNRFQYFKIGRGMRNSDVLRHIKTIAKGEPDASTGNTGHQQKED